MAAGAIIGSLALLASGLDSVIDGSASAILVWRFRLELRRTGHPDRGERLAAKAVGAAMCAAALYVLAQAARSLIVQARPGHSRAGLVVLTASILALPVLGYLKLRLAKQLRSQTLRDGASTREVPPELGRWQLLSFRSWLRGHFASAIVA